VKVYIVALDYQTRLVDDYGNLRIRLQVTGARCLLGEIYAIKSDKTAEEIKDYFKEGSEALRQDSDRMGQPESDV
jgi:hypothetical protein